MRKNEECRHRQGQLREASLSWAMCGKTGRERGERGTRCSIQEAQRYKEGEQPEWLDYIGKRSWGKAIPVPALVFRIVGRVCQPGGPCSKK